MHGMSPRMVPARSTTEGNRSMSEFKKGDKVLVNGALVATIEVYDTDVNQLVYSSELPGGATDTAYGHVSNTRLELIEAAPDELPLEEAPNPGSEK